MIKPAPLRPRAHKHLKLRHADHVVKGQRVLKIQVHASVLAILVGRKHLAAHADGDGRTIGQSRHFERDSPARLHGGKARQVSNDGIGFEKRQLDRLRAVGTDRKHQAPVSIFCAHAFSHQKKR